MSRERLYIVVFIASIIILATVSASQAGSVGKPEVSEDSSAATTTSASWLGSEINVCCNDEYDQQRPEVVYNRNHGEYMIVYHDGYSPNQVAGTRLNKDGNPFNWFAIAAIGAPDNINPDVAYSGYDDKYLVVWQQYNSSQNLWEIYGRFIPWDGPDYTITPFLIAQWSSMNLMYPKVAWNSYRNEYMVVWQTESTSSQLLGIGRRRIGANGAMLSNADYITQANSPGFPDITYNPASDQYLVVWAQIGNYYIDVYGGRLNREGTLQNTIFSIGADVNEQQFPVVTTNEQDRYLVVWQDDRLVQYDIDIYAQFLDVGGNPIGGNFWVAVSGDNETHPAVAANGLSQKYMIAYQKTTDSGESIWANLIDENAVFLDWFEVAPGGFGDNKNPAVATHSGYYVIYEWTSWTPGSTSELYGRTWSQHSLFLPLTVKGAN